MDNRLRALCVSALLAAWASAARPVPLQPTRYELDLRVDFKQEAVAGTARITLENSGTSALTEASFLLYRLMTVTAARAAAGAPLAFSQNVVAFEDDPKRQANQVRVLLAPPLEAGRSTVVEIAYGGYLAGYVETGALYIQDRVDEAFTILREDADAYPTLRPPSFEKIRAAGLPEFDYVARITVPASHVVANGGELVERTVRDGLATYVYRNLRPAWRMDFAIARFQTLQAPGLRVFALPQDAAGAERVLQAAGASMALYRDWFGPLRDAPVFTIIEIPDGWGSQADVTSILQAAAAFRDPGKMHELYHEVSHLWNVPSLDPSSCRWNEGLAAFLEARAAEKLDGGPVLATQAEKVAQRLRERLASEPALRSVPMIDYGKNGLTGDSYRTGMLMFYALFRLAGPRAFDAIVGNYYRKHEAAGGTTADFVREAEVVAGPGVTGLFDEWLFTTRWEKWLASGAGVDRIADRYRP
jgi:aminopeptidase N